MTDWFHHCTFISTSTRSRSHHQRTSARLQSSIFRSRLHLPRKSMQKCRPSSQRNRLHSDNNRESDKQALFHSHTSHNSTANLLVARKRSSDPNAHRSLETHLFGLSCFRSMKTSIAMTCHMACCRGQHMIPLAAAKHDFCTLPPKP
jgi:predicted outer membrane protein